jgi:hypothetical protein
MVINDFDTFGMPISPNKTDAPLVVDANAMLSGATAFQGLKAISRRGA